MRGTFSCLDKEKPRATLGAFLGDYGLCKNPNPKGPGFVSVITRSHQLTGPPMTVNGAEHELPIALAGGFRITHMRSSSPQDLRNERSDLTL